MENGNLIYLFTFINICFVNFEINDSFVIYFTFKNNICFRFRGRLISYNEFQSDDTRIELIDVGSFYQTKLDKTYDLPYYFLYDPLVCITFYYLYFFENFQ